MSNIKLEIDATDALVCSAFGNALLAIASRNDVSGSEPVTKTVIVADPATISAIKEGSATDVSVGYNAAVLQQSEPATMTNAHTATEGPFYWSDEDGRQVGSCDTEVELNGILANPGIDHIDAARFNQLHAEYSKPVTEATPPPPPATTATTTGADTVEVDADGMPWDKRIHTRTKSKTNDVWTVQRKPKNYETKEAWDVFVTACRLEHTGGLPPVPTPATNEVPPTPAVTEVPPTPATNEVPPTPAVVEVPPTPAVTEVPPTPAVTESAPSVFNDAPVTPPAPPAAELEEISFGQLMVYITKNALQQHVQPVITEFGVESMPLLNSQHADKIPQIYAKLKTLVAA